MTLVNLCLESNSLEIQITLSPRWIRNTVGFSTKLSHNGTIGLNHMFSPEYKVEPGSYCSGTSTDLDGFHKAPNNRPSVVSP